MSTSRLVRATANTVSVVLTALSLSVLFSWGLDLLRTRHRQRPTAAPLGVWGLSALDYD